MRGLLTPDFALWNFQKHRNSYGGDNCMRQGTVHEDMEIFMGRKDHCWRCAFLKPPTAAWVDTTEQINEGNKIKWTSRSVRWRASFVCGRSRVQILARRPAVLTNLVWRYSVSAGNFQGSTLNYINTRFLSHHFRFFIHKLSNISTLQGLMNWKCR